VSAAAVKVRRVLICEDSRTYAAGLSRLLERDRAIDVIGVCESAEEAIATLSRLKPDLVTMDLELPGMSGVDAIEQIMSVLPVPILVLSGHVERRSPVALTALAAGALDALPKSDLDLMDFDGAGAEAFRHRVKVLSGVKVIRHPRARLAGRVSVPESWTRTVSAIGICASTGGPQALATLLADVPATFPIPIYVVQHISASFVESFVRWLDGEVPLPVRVAAAGKPGPGIWIAPQGAHLVVHGDGRIAFDERADNALHRPSGDVLLRSLAAAAGGQTAAVVLTGMGRDGAEGLGEIRTAGGLTIAQDEATSAVYGMPRAAVECGAELVLPLAEIGPRIAALRPVGARS
jgi:two-component system, chemotaxis family, protein-glutamate methylesterase/glutaminase